MLLISLLFCGCDDLPFNTINELDKKIKNKVESEREITIIKTDYNNRISSVAYRPFGQQSVTIITDNKTGREYMYYDKTIIELKPKGE